MFMQSEEEEAIIAKFQRHGHPISKRCLEKAIHWLHEKKSNTIEILLKKLSQLRLENQNFEDNMLHAIQILSLKAKNMNSYEDLLEETRKRSIFYISPYETSQQNWFTEKPEKELFHYHAEDKLKFAQSQFKRIVDSNKDLGKESMIGVIYESYSNMFEGGKPRVLMQNQVNEVELNIPAGFVSQSLLISGCSYITKGKQVGKDLSLTVASFALPVEPQEQRNSLLKQKFKQMCQNITSGKETPGFASQDFLKYDCVYTSSIDQFKPTLIFGNVTLNLKTADRLRKLVEAYSAGVACVILMLSGDIQQPVDFGIWLRCKVFIVPHISSEGPRVLPKLPLLQFHVPSAKVLTNPARMSIEGREVVLVNYPIIKNIYSQCLLSEEVVKIPQAEMASRVSELIFSQGSIAIGQQFYWPQVDYFNISSETVVVISDNVAEASMQKSKGKGSMVTIGNFERDGEFLCAMAKSKNPIQLCQQPRE